jgi:uncharacterized protein
VHRLSSSIPKQTFILIFPTYSLVTQQHLQKITFACGLAGLLMIIGGSLSAQALPPAQPKQPATIPAEVKFKPMPSGQKLPLTAQVTIGKQNVLLEVVRTSEEQAMGLMYRTDLARDRGMLFVFSPPRPVSFWMKNTLIPLDIVFVSNGVVKYISAKTPPCKTDDCPGYGPDPKTPIDSVIELRSGAAAELNLKVGDRLKVSNYSAKKLK